MPKTVLITGCSSGIGKSTAELFIKKGWNVIATMRSPEKENELKTSENVLIEKLDVTDFDSIKNTIQNGIQKFGQIDVLVNNAGYGLIGPFEAASLDEIQKQFQTNVFGVFNTIREILPHFRQRREGIIINVTSMGGRLTFPFYSLYHGSKFAIEGFSDSLQFELRSFGIKVKLVEPGPIKTDFYDRSINIAKKEGLNDYDDLVNSTFLQLNSAGKNGSSPEVVAKMIFKAANDNSFRMRYVPDWFAWFLILVRSLVPNFVYQAIIRFAIMKKI